MKTAVRFLSLSAFLLMLPGVTATVAAQNHEAYFISAKAGHVNVVEGQASVRRAGLSERTELESGDKLNSGDQVRTDFDSRVEILLNPGSYLRLDEDTEIELTDAALDSLYVKILRGNAIFEITGTSDTQLAVVVSSPRQTFALLRKGLYRVNVSDEGDGELLVVKGRVGFGSDFKQIVKDGKRIVLDDGDPLASVAKLEKTIDGFDHWSDRRAETLAQANERVNNSYASNLMRSYRNSGAFGWGQSPYFGIWIFDAIRRCYFFYPFYDNWFSPYGYFYPRSHGVIWWDYPPYCPPPRPPSCPPSNTGGTQTGGATSKPSKEVNGVYEPRPKLTPTQPGRGWMDRPAPDQTRPAEGSRPVRTLEPQTAAPERPTSQPVKIREPQPAAPAPSRPTVERVERIERTPPPAPVERAPRSDSKPRKDKN